MAIDKYYIHPALFLSELYNFFEDYYSPKHKRVIVISLSEELLVEIADEVMSYPKNKIKIGYNFHEVASAYRGVYADKDIFTITRPCIDKQNYPAYLYSGWQDSIKNAMLEYMYNNDLTGVVSYLTKSERADLEKSLVEK